MGHSNRLERESRRAFHVLPCATAAIRSRTSANVDEQSPELTRVASNVDVRTAPRARSTWPQDRYLGPVLTRFDLVTIDVANIDRLAEFWCAALGLHETEREDGDRWIVLADAEGRRVLGLQRAEHRSGGLHLDLSCDLAVFDAEHARLSGLGALPVGWPRREPYGAIVNLSDPEGNPFDLCAYV